MALSERLKQKLSELYPHNVCGRLQKDSKIAEHQKTREGSKGTP